MKKTISLIFPLIFALSTSFQLFAQQRFPEDTGVQWIGDWPLGGAPEEVFLNNGRLLSVTESGVIEWDYNNTSLVSINSFPTRGISCLGAYSENTYTVFQKAYMSYTGSVDVIQLIDGNNNIILSMTTGLVSSMMNLAYNEFTVLNSPLCRYFQQYDISDPTDPELLVQYEHIGDRNSYSNDSLLVLGGEASDEIDFFRRDENNIWEHTSTLETENSLTFFLHSDTLLTISWEYSWHPSSNENEVILKRFLISDLTSPVALESDTLLDIISPEGGRRLSNARFLEVDDNHLIIATEEGYLSVIENHFSGDPVVIDTLIIDRYGDDGYDNTRSVGNGFRFREPRRRIARIDDEIFLPSGRGITTVNINDLENVFVDSSRCVQQGGHILKGYNTGNYLVTLKEIYYRRDLYHQFDVYNWDGQNWNEYYKEIQDYRDILYFFRLLNNRYLFLIKQHSNELIIRDMIHYNLSDTLVFDDYENIQIMDIYKHSENEYYCLFYCEIDGHEVWEESLYLFNPVNHAMEYITSTNTIYRGFECLFKDDYLYNSYEGNLYCYQLSDSLDFDNPLIVLEGQDVGERILSSNNYAWLSHGDTNNKIISIADPMDMQVLHEFDDPYLLWPRNSISENAFYIYGNYQDEFCDIVLDFTYPYNPQRVATIGVSVEYPMIHDFMGLSFSLGDTLWVIDKYTITGYKMDYEVGVEESSIEEIPSEYVLHPCRPNPFNPSTSITLEVPELTNVKLVVYNTLGQQIATLADKKLATGRHRFIWNGKNSFGQDVASGIYFIQMQAKTLSLSQKMLLLR